MSNTIKSVSLVSPFRTVDAGACFTIDTPATPFLLQGVCKVAGEYVFSGWIKADTTATIELGTVKAEIETDWTRVVIPLLKSASDTEDVAIYFNTVTTYYMYHAQLEMGNKSTKWQPAPGDVTKSIEDTVSTIEEVRKSIDPAIQKATEFITGNRGGYVVFHRSVDSDGNESEYPDEILIMDSPYTTAAKNIWRWNKSGLGHSSNGIDGPYELAILANGSINADFIKTGKLSANQIEGGTMSSSAFMSSSKNDNEDFYRQMEIDRAMIGISSNDEKLDTTLYNEKMVPRVRIGNSNNNNGYLELFSGNSKNVKEQNSDGTVSYHGECGYDGSLFRCMPNGIYFFRNNATAGGISINSYGTGVGIFGQNEALYTYAVAKNATSGRDVAYIYDTEEIQFSKDGNFCGVLAAYGDKNAPKLSLIVDSGDTFELGHITKRTIDSNGRQSGNVNYNNNITIDTSGVMHIYDTINYQGKTLDGCWTWTFNDGQKIQYIKWK